MQRNPSFDAQRSNPCSMQGEYLDRWAARPGFFGWVLPIRGIQLILRSPPYTCFNVFAKTTEMS
jgi:hypothetical protein